MQSASLVGKYSQVRNLFSSTVKETQRAATSLYLEKLIFFVHLVFEIT